MVRFILASGSPRRSDLLSQAGYDFKVQSAEVEECPPGRFPLRELCMTNAALKAREVSARCPGAVVLGADTLVALGGEVMGKPCDIVEAMCMLERLSGKVHEVCTGVCICGGSEERVFFEVTRVWFRDFGKSVIKDYTKRVNVIDKAGSYAIQEHGEMLADRVEGPFDNVVGLPMEKVAGELERFAILPRRT